jgi:hypothetical protein
MLLDQLGSLSKFHSMHARFKTISSLVGAALQACNFPIEHFFRRLPVVVSRDTSRPQAIHRHLQVKRLDTHRDVDAWLFLVNAPPWHNAELRACKLSLPIPELVSAEQAHFIDYFAMAAKTIGLAKIDLVEYR